MLALLGALEVLLVASPTRAQSASGAPITPATVRAPVLRTPSPATYPEQAIRGRYFEPVAVVLILDIDASGSVTAAAPQQQQADAYGFGEAARAAAMKLSFEPAERGGTPIASRIKYEYRFTPPPPPPPPLLRGRLARGDSDAPLPGVDVTVTTSDGKDHVAVTDASGRFGFDDLPPGAIHVRASAPGLASVDADETLANAEETSLILRAAVLAPPVAATAPGAEVPEEVAVRGERPAREVVKRSLSAKEMAQIPGTNGDALRSVQSLPGVARPPPFGGQLIVRGSATEDTQIFVDGTPVPLVYHFGGLSSVLPTESLERLDFYPGNFSTVYGRGMGGVVDVGVRDPRSDRVHALAQADLVDLRLMVEGPLGKGFSFRAAGRRSWFDAWLGPVLESTNAGVSTLPRYYDYQLMIQKDWSSNHSARVTFFGSDDAFKSTFSGGSSAATSGTLGVATRFWRLQGLYRQRLTDRLDFKVTTAAGRDIENIAIGINAFKSNETSLSLRSEVAYKIAPAVRANVGTDIAYTPYTLDFRLPASARATSFGVPGDRTITSSAKGERLLAGVYTEWELTPWRGGRVVPGFRADHTSDTKRTDLSPRINVRQELTSGDHGTALKGGVGLFLQPPSLFESAPTFGQRGLRSKRSVHYDVGADQQLTRELKLSLDGFYKSFDRLVVAGAGNSGEGRAFGVESLLRYQGSDRFFGWVAYTISRSERRDSGAGLWQSFQSDQTHILTALGSYALGRGWRVGGRFRLVSGNLYTPTAGGAYNATVGTYLNADSTATYSARLPLFHQLDLRVDKTWTFRDWSLTGYVDIQNIYNQRAAEDVTYNYDYTSSAYLEGLTIFPSIGIRAEL